MLPVSPALAAFLDAQQQALESRMAIAELFTFTLANGTVLRYTGADVNIVSGGHVYAANGPLIEGLKYNASVGLDIDQQEITLAVDYSASVQPTVDNVPFMTAVQLGLFEGCEIMREWAIFSDQIGGTLVGVVTRYKGLFVDIKAGRLEAKVTVANSLIVLTQNMPRRTFAPTCQHVFGDQFCGVALAGETTWTGATVAGSTTTRIRTPLASAAQIGGQITFTSGALAGLSRTITAAAEGVSVSVAAVPSAPAAGVDISIVRPNSVATNAGAGSTQALLKTPAALFLHIGGLVTFTSGANAGLSATVKNAAAGEAVWLAFPMPNPVGEGDAFTLALGCDHTEATCVRMFNNVLNFFGFPQVPPPQTAI